MGGKKKKGLSSRLAKMSDEEKARYLQHRAAIEEEAKRRKEQLIATYMKNKLKREEAFTRLNIAKINENWHQILRKIKVKGLKTEIEDLQIWITKILEIKNSIINRLMTEIEESEQQYQINLKSHLSHVDDFIDINNDRQEFLKEDYEKFRDEILYDANKELTELSDKAYNEERYLKTILFGMEKNFDNFVKEMQNFRQSKLEDYSNSLRAEHETMVKTYGQQMLEIWKDINKILKGYLARTTQKRHHYIELKHCDERNAVERNKDERRIQKYTEQINSLNLEHELLFEKNEAQIKDLTHLRQKFTTEFQDLKRNLTSTIRRDEKILKNMAVFSNEAIKNLEKLDEKGTNIRNFVTCCSRLQTADEKLIQWAKFHGKLEHPLLPESEKTSEETSRRASSSAPRDSFESSDNALQDLSEDKSLSEYNRPPESKLLPEGFDFLSKMEGLWWCCNRAEIESVNLKRERSELIAENRNMKKIIKGILRDAALETPPPPEICFPVYTRVVSAPIKTQKMDLYGLDFLVIDL